MKKALSLLIFVCFVFSAIVGPAYGVTYEHNGVIFDVDIHTNIEDFRLWNKYQAVTNDTYNRIFIKAEKDGKMLGDLEMVSYSDLCSYYKNRGENWLTKFTAFDIKTKDVTGEHYFSFTGTTETGEKILFLMPIEFVDSNNIRKEVVRLQAQKECKELLFAGPNGELISFPKRFKDEEATLNRSVFYGGALGFIGSCFAYGGYHPKSLADLFTVIPIILAAGTVVGMMMGYNAGRAVYYNSDVGWIESDPSVRGDPLYVYKEMLYSTKTEEIYDSPESKKVIGELKKREFRKILDKKHADDIIWYKIKINEIPEFAKEVY